MQTTQQRNTNGSDAKQVLVQVQDLPKNQRCCLNYKERDDIPDRFGAADSGSAFADMAGGLLDSIAPAEGSAVKLKITGAIPLYKTPYVEVTFKPTLKWVSNEIWKDGYIMGLSAGVEVSAGVEIGCLISKRHWKLTSKGPSASQETMV